MEIKYRLELLTDKEPEFIGIIEDEFLPRCGDTYALRNNKQKCMALYDVIEVRHEIEIGNAEMANCSSCSLRIKSRLFPRVFIKLKS